MATIEGIIQLAIVELISNSAHTVEARETIMESNAFVLVLDDDSPIRSLHKGALGRGGSHEAMLKPNNRDAMLPAIARIRRQSDHGNSVRRP